MHIRDIARSGPRKPCLLAAAIAVALACLTPVMAAAASLEEEMQGLIDNHPQIQSKTKAVNSAEEGIRAARSGYLPTVKMGSDEGYEYIDSPDRRTNYNKPYSNNRDSAGLTVTEKIFDGFATDSAVEAAKASHQISTSDLRATRQSTLLEGAFAYMDVLRYTRLVTLARESQRKVTDQLHMEDERLEKGAGVTSDVLAAKQRLETAKARRVEFEGGFQTAVAKFTQVFGHAPDVVSLTDPPLPVDLIPETIEDSLDAAEKDNPSLQSATKTIDLTDERRHTAEAGYWPTVDLVGKTDYEDGKNGVVGPRRDWSMLLVANWELFSGFKTDALVAQAAWDHAASKDNRLYTSRKVSEAVRTSWHKFETAKQRLELLGTAATLAEEVWEAEKKKEAAGKATVQQVLDEETRINDARINYTGAYYDMFQAAYELLSGMGRLEVEGLARAKSSAMIPELPSLKSSMELPRSAAKPPAPARQEVAGPATAAPAATPVARAIAADSAATERLRSPAAARDEFWTVRQ